MKLVGPRCIDGGILVYKIVMFQRGWADPGGTLESAASIFEIQNSMMYVDVGVGCLMMSALLPVRRYMHKCRSIQIIND